MLISEIYDFNMERHHGNILLIFLSKNNVIFIHLYQMKNLSFHRGWSQIPYSLSIYQDHRMHPLARGGGPKMKKMAFRAKLKKFRGALLTLGGRG